MPTLLNNSGRRYSLQTIAVSKLQGGIILSDQICSNNVQRTYTVEQISKILGVSLRKTYYLCEHTTDFKVIRLGKRCLRIHKESFDSWFNALDQS